MNEILDKCDDILAIEKATAETIKNINAQVKRIKAEKEKYRWHDLRKDKSDLPNELKVMCCFKYSKYDKEYTHDSLWYGKVDEWDYPELKGKKAFHFSDRENGDVVIEDVIAWRYIEKFLEE